MPQVGIFENLLLLLRTAAIGITLSLVLSVPTLFLFFLLFYFFRAFTQLLGLVHRAIVVLRFLNHLVTLDELVLGRYIALYSLLLAHVAELAEHDL
jgi:hypothetical protein